MIKFPIYIGKYTSSKCGVLGRGKRLELSFSRSQAESIFFSQAAPVSLMESSITALYRRNLLMKLGKEKNSMVK